MFGGCTFDVTSCRVNKVIEAMAGLVFFDPLNEGSAGLPYTECFTVFARNLVYYILLMFGRGGSFCVREYRSQGIRTLEDCPKVILLSKFTDKWKQLGNSLNA